MKVVSQSNFAKANYFAPPFLAHLRQSLLAWVFPSIHFIFKKSRTQTHLWEGIDCLGLGFWLSWLGFLNLERIGRWIGFSLPSINFRKVTYELWSSRVCSLHNRFGLFQMHFIVQIILSVNSKFGPNPFSGSWTVMLQSSAILFATKSAQFELKRTFIFSLHLLLGISIGRQPLHASLSLIF